ncbi:hypothetical protein [Nocardia tengchongensis]|uniref:hypothetical protein n=1 Tax=Nocardia tengchongensis TaxID=2055889 RepID=UPI003675D26D
MRIKMKLYRRMSPVVIAAVLATAGVAASGNATASPGSTAPVDSTHYQGAIVGDSVVATVGDGKFVQDTDTETISLRDSSGATIDSTPTAYVLDGQRYPIATQISADGHTLRLTPQLPANTGGPAVRPVASPLENQLAMNDLMNSVGFGLSTGTLVGTIVGAVIGVGAGLAIAGASCLVLSIGCVLTVAPLMSMMGAAGGVVGLALGGAPGLLQGLWNYYTTMQAAPGESQYASQLPGLAKPAPQQQEAGQ